MLDEVVSLASSPAGRTVWALTKGSSGTVLQSMTTRGLPVPKPARRAVPRALLR